MAFALVLATLALDPHPGLRTDILGMLSLRHDLKAATPPLPPLRPAMTEPLPATDVVERVAQPAPMLAEAPPPSPPPEACPGSVACPPAETEVALSQAVAPTPVQALAEPIRPPPALWLPTPALQEAAALAEAATGIRAETLLAIAAAESGLRPHARNSRSTATGPFQFTEEGWLRTVRSFGARHGLQAEATRITTDSRGRLQMRDARLRRALMQRRTEVVLTTLMAAESARDNARRFARTLGRVATDDEIYAMHLLGLGRLLRLVRMAEGTDGAHVAQVLPADVLRHNAELIGRMAGSSGADALISIQGRYADRFSGVNPPHAEAIHSLNEIVRLHRHLATGGLVNPGIGNAALESLRQEP